MGENRVTAQVGSLVGISAFDGSTPSIRGRCYGYVTHPTPCSVSSVTAVHLDISGRRAEAHRETSGLASPRLDVPHRSQFECDTGKPTR
jgi:hypothetical protein